MARVTRPFTAISFSSSGVLFIGQMGAYCHLYEAGILSQVTDYYGCSGGSLAAYLCILGVTPAWIREWVQHFDTRPIMNMQEDLIVDYLTSWGVDSGAQAVNYMSKFVDTWEPGASKWTFADLARERPGRRFCVTATNVSMGLQEVFSVDRCPSMRIVDALRASCGVPFYLTPWTDPSSGHIFCDGAILELTPTLCVRDPETTLFIVCKNESESDKHPTSLGEYIHKLVRLMIKDKISHELDNVLHAGSCGITPLNFMISKEDRLRIFTSGLADGLRWLRQHFPGETAEIPPLSGDLHTLSADCLSSESVSDIHRSENPLPSRAPSQDLLPPSSRRSRRWSY